MRRRFASPARRRRQEPAPSSSRRAAASTASAATPSQPKTHPRGRSRRTPLEVARRDGPPGAWRRHLHRHQPPLRDGLRHERPAAPRSCAQRLRRIGDRYRDHHHPQRRNAVAPADPRCRHGPRDRLGSRPRSRRRRHLPRCQRWLGRVELPVRELADEVARAIPGVDVSLAATGGPDRALLPRELRALRERSLRSPAGSRHPAGDRGVERGPRADRLRRPGVPLVAVSSGSSCWRSYVSGGSSTIVSSGRRMSTPTPARADAEQAVAPTLSLVRRAARPRLRRPRELPARQRLPDRGATRAARAVLPAARLRLRGCFLVQLPQVVTPAEMFSDYAYFSSYSESWLRHARDVRGADDRALRSRLDEQGRRDREQRRLPPPVLQGARRAGARASSPPRNVAAAAHEAGIPTLVEFFGLDTADELRLSGEEADLLVGNNVLAHVPDLTGFVAGLKLLLKPGGVVTLEFPHLLRLIENGRVRHDLPRARLVLLAARGRASLRSRRAGAVRRRGAADARRLPAHLRSDTSRTPQSRRHVVSSELREREREAGLERLETYTEFDERVRRVKRDLLEFLDRCEAGGQVDRRLRSRREGQHAPQLLRDPRRLRRLRRRPQPAQAGSLPARDASTRSATPEEVEATSPTTSCSCPGT